MATEVRSEPRAEALLLDGPQAATAPATRLPPGPRLPAALQTFLIWRRPRPFLTRAHRRFGPVFTIRAFPWETVVVIDDPALVKQVFTGDATVFHAGDGNSLLAPVLGRRSVLVLDEDEHLRTRKRLLPPFHGEAVRRYERVIEEIVSAEVDSWPIGKPFALHPRMRAITLVVILRAVIGVTDPTRLAALRTVLPRTVEIGPTITLMWRYPRLGRFARWRRFRASVHEANRLLREEIASRRCASDLGEREDVLSLLMRAGEMDDAELRDQIMTLLLAGHETTTTGLAWAFERLLRHPAELARAKEGDDAYLDAVVAESLRARPVVPAVLRQLRAPVELGGFRLPAGVTVMPSIILMHADPGLYPNPDRFRPERFLGEHQSMTYTCIPFGGGRRRCLGSAFACFEMRVALRTILRKATLRADRAAPERVRPHHITLVPARGARVIREA